MKALAFLPLVLAGTGHVQAADPIPHGANSTISNIVCMTVDLEPNDGVAPYARLVNTRRDYGPYWVSGSLTGPAGFNRSRTGTGLESIYLTLDEQGSSGSAMLVPSGNGTVGLLSVSSATSPGRTFDGYFFAAGYYPWFKLGPNSAIECKASYVITAWAKTTANAPANAVSKAQVNAYEANTGEGWTGAEVKAAANPNIGNRYGQKAGQLVLRLYNYGGSERSVFGAFSTQIDGGP